MPIFSEVIYKDYRESCKTDPDEALAIATLRALAWAIKMQVVTDEDVEALENKYFIKTRRTIFGTEDSTGITFDDWCEAIRTAMRMEDDESEDGTEWSDEFAEFMGYFNLEHVTAVVTKFYKFQGYKVKYPMTYGDKLNEMTGMDEYDIKFNLIQHVVRIVFRESENAHCNPIRGLYCYTENGKKCQDNPSTKHEFRDCMKTIEGLIEGRTMSSVKAEPDGENWDSLL